MANSSENRLFSKERRNQLLFNDLVLIVLGSVLLAAKLGANTISEILSVGFLVLPFTLIAVFHANAMGYVKFPCRDGCDIFNDCEERGPCQRWRDFQELVQQTTAA